MATMAQVAGLAFDAGIRSPARLAQAVAVAVAESGLSPTRLGDVQLQDATWGPSVGLWQIRSLKAEKGTGKTRDQDRLTDPAFNAKAMFEISKGGTDFSAWSVTYPTRDPVAYMRYQAALVTAGPAVTEALATKGAAATIDAGKDAVDGVTEPVRELAGTISDAAQTPVRMLNWLSEPGTWTRIAFGALGAIMLVGGLVAVVGKPAMSVVNATPVGKIAKLAKGGK